jgi:hypothetical protein
MNSLYLAGIEGVSSLLLTHMVKTAHWLMGKAASSVPQTGPKLAGSQFFPMVP